MLFALKLFDQISFCYFAHFRRWIEHTLRNKSHFNNAKKS